jgi:DNA repair protein SbcD/Mre11
MLRLIHTADWHIGRTLNGWSRITEHERFLAQLADLVVEHEADALVVAGDVFDTMAPSAQARELFFRAVDRLSTCVPRLTTVIVAGNHDHAGQLEAPQLLLRRHRVHAIGTMAGQGGSRDLERHLIALRDRQGKVQAHVLAVPFLTVSDIPRPAEAQCEGSPVVAGVRQLYDELIGLARQAIGTAPLVVTGHLTLAGGAETELSERRILIGGEHAVPHDIFPADLAYVALGHLHKPQEVGRATIRYAGSPLPMSATERPYRHGVSLVTIGEAGVGVQHLELARPVPFIRLPQSGALERTGVEGAFADLKLGDVAVAERPFVHVAVRVDGPATGLRAEIDQIAERFPVRMAAPPEIVRPALPTPDAATAAPPQLKDMDPLDLFTRAFVECHQAAPEPEHLAAFAEIGEGD